MAGKTSNDNGSLYEPSKGTVHGANLSVKFELSFSSILNNYIMSSRFLSRDC